MSHCRLSRHARRRAQQRGIPSRAVELVLDYGRPIPRGQGATLHFLGRPEAREAIADGHPIRDSWIGVGVLVGSEGRIITVAHYPSQPRATRGPGAKIGR